MKSILKKVAGVAVAAVLALGMIGCSNGSDDPVMPPVSGKQTVATPEFNVASGAVDGGTEVTITCATEGAKIYYTTDGSDPTASSTEYTAAISVTAAVTLKAIAVKDGMNDSAVASASYSIIPTPGDFVLKDGTILSKDETPESGTVAAVIVRAAADGKPALGVGIVHSTSGLEWCTRDAEGHSIDITSLHSGYEDGRDGWEKLKAACPDAESNPENYPAWNYSLTYAKNNSLTGDLATGWYLPTLTELNTICKNKTAVDESLSKAGGSTFGTSSYWSCIQHSLERQKHYAYSYGFGISGWTGKEGYSCESPKSSNYPYVCSVRAFN